VLGRGLEGVSQIQSICPMNLSFLPVILFACSICQCTKPRYLCPSLIACISDDVCKKNMAGSCIDGFCFPMKPAGSWCTHAEECASFFYYGKEACGEQCRPMDACQAKLKKFVARQEFACCKPIPIGGKCRISLGMFQKCGFHGGCDLRSTCSVSTAGTSESNAYCLPRSTVQWKFVAALTILSSVILNYAYVQRRFYISANALPTSTGSSMLLVMLGNLACFFGFLFGSLSFVAPLSCCGFMVRLWFGIACKRVKMQFFVDISYTVYLVAGTVLVFMNGQKHEQLLNACQIIYLFFEEKIVYLLILLSVAFIVVYFVVKLIEANMIMRPSRYLEDQPIERMAVLTQKPLLNPYDAIFRVNSIYFVPDSATCMYFLPFCYAYLVVYFMLGVMLSSKILWFLSTQSSELSLDWLEHSGQIVFFTILLVICMIEHFYWTLKSFRRISNRILEIGITILSVVVISGCGAIIFEDLHDFDTKRLLFYLSGSLLLLLAAIGIIIRKEET
jgi:hypothetical protein